MQQSAGTGLGRGVHPPEPMKHSPLFEKNLCENSGAKFSNTFSGKNSPLYPPKFLTTFFSRFASLSTKICDDFF